MDTRTRQAFPLVPRHRLSGLPFGAAQSVRRGRGSDVAGSRPYRRTDPISTIDWRASARLSTARDADEFVVRERYAEEAPRVVLLCDRRPSMGLYPAPFPWLDKPAVVRAVADAVVLSALAARGTVGYLDFSSSDRRRGQPFWLPPRGRAEWRRIGERQDAAPPFDAPEDNLERGLAFLGRFRSELASGTFVFVVSDFLAPPSAAAWLAASAHLWELVPVVVQDPVWEQSFPVVGPLVLPLTDPATGRMLEARLTSAEAHARRHASERRRAELLAAFASLGLDYVLVETSDPGAVDIVFLAWAARRRDLRHRT